MMKNFTDDTFLGRWLNNELTASELEAFKASEEYALYVKIAEKSTQFEVPQFNDNQVFENIKKTIQQPKSTKVRSLYMNWASIAAAVVLLFVGINYWVNSPTIYSTKNGEKVVYELPDGSSVELNGISSVKFNKKDWKKNQRNLELEGEGYFKVKKGSKFNVKSKQGIVSVVGTQFNVQVIDHFFAVECYEGKVLVKKELSETLLLPNKRIRFKNGKKENSTISNKIPNWINNNYIYNATPLNVVITDLKNTYKLDIAIKDVNLSQEFTGKLITTDVDKALQVICKAMKLRYSINNNKIRINNL